MKNIIVIMIFAFPALCFGQGFYSLTPTSHPFLDYTMVFSISQNGSTYSLPSEFGYKILLDDGTSVSASYLDPNGGPFLANVNFYYGGVFNVTIEYYIGSGLIGFEVFNGIEVSSASGSGCCSMTMNTVYAGVLDNGEFFLDKATGGVVFRNEANCSSFENFNCVSFDNTLPLENVISANAQVFASDWFFDNTRFPEKMDNIWPNSVETGQTNKWRVRESYTYKSELDESIISTAALDDYKNYDRGTFSYEQFLWREVGSNDFDKWIRTSLILEYTGNGDVSYEQNALLINSGAIYGYNNTQVVGVVQHGRYFEISFESFENIYDFYLPTGSIEVFDNGVERSANVTQTTDESHTGKYSIKPTDNQYFNIAPSINRGLWSNTDVIDGDGYLIQAWVKSTSSPTLTVQATDYFLHSISKSMHIAQACGEWSLYESELNGVDLSSGGIVSTRIKFEMKTSSFSDVYIDDIKIQPIKSEMVSYVYDDQFRIVASFDSQHFALIYQYNEEGKLIRKLKETANGVVTLSETKYNSVGKIRD